jgi:hypothetical protein
MEYERNNVTVSASAEKELQVAVKKIKMYSSEFYFRAEIDINVKYGNGFVETIRVGRSSTGSPFMKMFFPRKPLKKAFKDSVKDIINNKNIQKYINK